MLVFDCIGLMYFAWEVELFFLMAQVRTIPGRFTINRTFIFDQTPINLKFNRCLLAC